ncbi:proliferating cell nuclear antigen (pcna) [Candidatus Woesearchaeota archaeon]|nr:proliferating cell nuclear antigen (pcna) [Candidatus Woesearchaeota archaeon]MCF7900618.1 proliferating cell nuclear antigen (pcna) [Candidatus Woesearchaeota archaeon]MCF8013459.1 proliferating cell nuclear antigen (pcna) [Candidatus Woesearchaeota archaeon]
MKFTLAEPKLLKESIAIISDLVTETKIKATKDMLQIIAMDPANVAMVIFKMPSSTFAEYVIDEDMTIAINMGNLKQILRRVKSNDVLTLEATENKLKIIMKAKNTKTFQLPLIDLEEKDQKIPNLTAKATIEMTSTTFNEAIEDVDIVSESVTFTAIKDKLTIAASGDLTKAEVEINQNEDVKIELETDEPQRSKYSVEYLKKMMQGSKLSETVTLKFSKDYPITITYKELDKLELSFILAPRVDND